MSTQDFTTSIVVDQTPAEVYRAVNDPRAWWSDSIEGEPANLNGEWTYHFGGSHRSKLKTVEMSKDKRVVWLVTENFFDWTRDEREWTGNRITFEISQKDGKTQLVFTQIGLVPAYECFTACRDAWTGFVQKSLYRLITTGTGALKWYEES